MIRILTEDKGPEGNQRIRDILASVAVESFNVTHGSGYWKGIPERSIAIDIVGADVLLGRVIAERIKAVNLQETVLVLDIPVTSHFV